MTFPFRWLLFAFLCLLFGNSASAHYDPRMGRWLSRDPLGEQGGFNLYAYCGNDPVNRHDPLGLADQFTVAQADHVDMLLSIAELTGDFGDGMVAMNAKRGLMDTLNRDPEPWAFSIYQSGGAAGLASYVGNRDRILGESFQMGATGLFYGGAALRTFGGAAEFGIGAAWSWSTGSVGAFLGGGTLALNGWDNMQSGARTIASGEYQPAWLEGKMSGTAYFATQLGIGGLPVASRLIGSRLAPRWNPGNYYLTADSFGTGGLNVQLRYVSPEISAILKQQRALSILVNREGAVIDRWLSASDNEWAQMYRSNLTSNPNFASGIRGRFLDIRMRQILRKKFSDRPDVRIDQTIPGSGSDLRPDLYFPSLEGRSVIFDIGSPSKIDGILKYEGMADELIPVIPKQWFR